MERTINIGIVTYNRIELTELSIKSMLDTINYSCIISVVDNGSTDGTVEYLKKIHDDGIIKNLILLNENMGGAAASNLAWQLEDTEYYLKYDNDMRAKINNWLAPMIEILDNVDEIGMIGYNVSPKIPQISKIKNYKIRKTGCTGGACVLIPKRTRNNVGYWCEDYGMYGPSDADYCGRNVLAGKIVAYMEKEDAFDHMQTARENDHPKYRQFKNEWFAKTHGIYTNNMHKYSQNPPGFYVPFKSKLTDYSKYIRIK